MGSDNVSRDTLLRLVERIEWVQPMDNGSPRCPNCENRRDEGHARGCGVAKALGRRDGPPPHSTIARILIDAGGRCDVTAEQLRAVLQAAVDENWDQEGFITVTVAHEPEQERNHEPIGTVTS